MSGLGAQGICCLDRRVGLGRGLSARGSQQGEAQARKLFFFWPKAGRTRRGPKIVRYLKIRGIDHLQSGGRLEKRGVPGALQC